MSASRAMSRIEVPWYPRSFMFRNAESRIACRPLPVPTVAAFAALIVYSVPPVVNR